MGVCVCLTYLHTWCSRERERRKKGIAAIFDASVLYLEKEVTYISRLTYIRA